MKRKKKLSPEAQIYEKAWNDYVSQLSDHKKNIIINNFTVVSGQHVYNDRYDQRVANEVAKEVRIIAEEQIEALFPTGKY
tara:strand:+ start:1340 stop:1579 length:240 start_codon:yes stop_codon:yes gene_type:complete